MSARISTSVLIGFGTVTNRPQPVMVARLPTGSAVVAATSDSGVALVGLANRTKAMSATLVAGSYPGWMMTWLALMVSANPAANESPPIPMLTPAGLLDPKQCAAVSTQSGAMTLPVQLPVAVSTNTT